MDTWNNGSFLEITGLIILVASLLFFGFVLLIAVIQSFNDDNQA